METRKDAEPALFDKVKLGLAALILVGGVVGYYYFAEANALLRAMGVLVAFGVAVWVTFQSALGRTLWRFIQDARVELRKVVWPTREETIQTTMIVLVFAVIMGVFFWLLDFSLLWFTGLVTGRGS